MYLHMEVFIMGNILQDIKEFIVASSVGIAIGALYILSNGLNL